MKSYHHLSCFKFILFLDNIFFQLLTCKQGDKLTCYISIYEDKYLLPLYFGLKKFPCCGIDLYMNF